MILKVKAFSLIEALFAFLIIGISMALAISSLDYILSKYHVDPGKSKIVFIKRYHDGSEYTVKLKSSDAER